MDAKLIPKNNSTELNDYQKRLIIAAAIRQTDGIPKRAERLKQLDFCTDSVKFEVLRESNKVDDKLYNELFKLYFAQKDNTKKPELSSILQGPGWKEVEAKPRKLTDDEIRKMIDLYNRGTKIKELGVIFRRTTQQISSLIYSWKRSDKYKELFKMNAITESDKKETDIPRKITARGKGFLSTDTGLKLDEEPITTMIRQKLVELGLAQFYAEVEIVIKQSEPTGMVVEVEE
jgi:hypothetical protein